jgi:Secretion system C-terminal sorting domain
VRVASIKLNSTPQIIRDEPYSITLRARGVSQGNPINYKDVSYLFFTKDIELPIITDVKHEEKNGIEIYPNPFSNYFKLTFDSEGINDLKNVKIFSVSGELVAESKLNSEGQFDTSNLSAGFYILQIDNKKVKALKK